MPIKHVTMIGCGNMAGAMAQIWLEKGIIENLHIIKPSPPNERLSNDARVSYSPDFDIPETDIVMIGVKPQIIPDIAENVKSNLPNNASILSIAAGVTLEKLQNYFGDMPIIRSMPNLPASIGKAITGSISNAHISKETKEYADQLLSACGMNIWVDTEDQMDSITAVSASGSGFTYYFIEALAEAAKKTGLSKEISQQLARQTVIGSAALAEKEEAKTIETLRKNVTSAKGTTEAGLSVLMDGRFSEIMNETVQAAKKRSKELSQ